MITRISADMRAVGRLGVWSMISCGWGSTVWPDTHLTYMIDIALTTEFAITAGGAR